jgi:hypothetical protein
MKLNRDQLGKFAAPVLGAAALYMVWANLLSNPSAPSPTPPPRSAPTAAAPTNVESAPVRKAASRVRSDEFHPVYRSKRAEDRVDPGKVDPTLRTDLLAKVEKVEPAGGSRNLFVFGQPPKPAELPKGPEPRIAMGPPKAPEPAPPAPPAAEAPPAPITLKFYGYATVRNNGRKSAYFLDGEDILIASEGETLKRRYKLVRITSSSVLLEDTESKKQQSVPLTPEEGPRS